MYSLAFLPSSVPSLDRGAQHVAGGDVGQAEVLAQALGLRALAGPGRAEQDEVELDTRRQRTPSRRSRSTAGRRPDAAAGLLQEALVVAHHQLRLELLHRVQRDADDDQQRGAAEEEVRAASG